MLSPWHLSEIVDRVAGQGSDGSKQLLLKRLRCVAFAALAADATEDELRAAIRIAVEADVRRKSARPKLRLVR